MTETASQLAARIDAAIAEAQKTAELIRRLEADQKSAEQVRVVNEHNQKGKSQ